MARGLAAIAVVVGHARGLFLVDWSDIAQDAKSAGLQGLYAATGFGHQAVMVFFVLSGYLVGGSVLRTARNWSWPDYLSARLVRLYVVLIPALVLTAVLDRVALQLPSGPRFLGEPIAHLNTVPIVGQMNWTAFVGNAAFLQTIAVPTFGSNLPLWSLANEFWYYMLFPLLTQVILGSRRPSTKALYGILVVGLCGFLPVGLFVGFVIWMLGVVVYAVPGLPPRARGLQRVLLTVCAAGFTIVLLMGRIDRLPGSGDLVVGVAFAGLLYMLIQSGPLAPSAGYARTAKLLAGCSFSVYALHFPLLLAIRSGFGPDRWFPSPSALAAVAAIVVADLAVCYSFSVFTEARTGALRALVLRRG